MSLASVKDEKVHKDMQYTVCVCVCVIDTGQSYGLDHTCTDSPSVSVLESVLGGYRQSFPPSRKQRFDRNEEKISPYSDAIYVCIQSK